MCVKGKKCSARIHLDSVGILVEGCLRSPSWLGSISVPCSQSIFNQAKYVDTSECKLVYRRNISHGKFGYIDIASYQKTGESKEIDVYVKRPIIAGKSLLYEACIQKLVGESLATIGFPTGAPRLVNIFRLKDNSICFAMEQIEGSKTLDRYLDSVPRPKIAEVIIDCLLQLCAMIWHLDRTLGINHRDLKPSNFLIVEHEKPIQKILTINCDIIEIESKHSLTFIDFGFSCLGSTETHKSDISLSTVYSKEDPCPKEGRDMYLFLAFLYIDYHMILPTQLLHLFEEWLDISNSNLCKFIQKDKESAKEWIYWITGNEKIKKFNTCPIKIIKDLQKFI
jgi:serine/threonine protein kinase